MGVKISELPVASSANNNDSLILNHGGATRRITLENLIQAGKIAAQLLSDADLEAYLDFYVSESQLSDALSGFLSESDLSGFLSESDMSSYVTMSYLSEAIGNYVSEALGDVVTSSYLSEELAHFVSSAYLSEALADYLSESDLDDYVSSDALSETLSDYVSVSGLSDALSDYVTSSAMQDYLRDGNYVTDESLSGYLSNPDIEPYLSEGLAGLGNLLSAADLDEAGYVSSSSFAAALEAYLTEYGGQTIYDAISQYINQ